MNSTVAIPAALSKVPPFPAVAAKLLGVLSNPAADNSEVAELIGSDPTLTAQILKEVNSYQYGLKSQVKNIRQAIPLIGLDRTRQIVTTTATATYVRRVMTAELLRCWHHAIATAVLAEVIAQACGAFENLAYVGGIIHDLGRLALLVAYPEDYHKLLLKAEKLSLDLLDEEERKFGMTHAEAGRLLTEMWGLPEEFRVINGRHHDPSDGSELDLLRIVHVACQLADSLGFVAVSRKSIPPSTILNELPAYAVARLRKTPEELAALIEEHISAVT